ncbi:hypothetical protein GCM10023405_36350 [Streptomonospora salina]
MHTTWPVTAPDPLEPADSAPPSEAAAPTATSEYSGRQPGSARSRSSRTASTGSVPAGAPAGTFAAKAAAVTARTAAVSRLMSIRPR